MQPFPIGMRLYDTQGHRLCLTGSERDDFRRAAEKAPSEEERRRLLTFVVVGGGPTGAELAGMFPVISRHLREEFRLADTARKYANAKRDEELAFWMEMILEGLHQALRLAREDLDSMITFQELMKYNVLRTVR